MNKIIFLITFIFFSNHSKCQLYYFGFTQLFIDGILTWQEGGYDYKYTWYGTETAQVHGLKGGWFLNENQKSLIGFSMYLSFGEINQKILYYRQNIAMFYSTLYYEHTFFSENKMNISPFLHIGWGIAYTDGNAIPQNATTISQFLLIEPGANAYYKIFNWCKIGGGLSYRNTFGSKLYNANDNVLSATNINFSVKFGNYKKH